MALRKCALAALVALAAGCKGDGPPPLPGVIALPLGHVQILSISPNHELFILRGDTATVQARIIDGSGAPYQPAVSLTFTSSAPAVAEVSVNGFMTARTVGIAFVTAQVLGTPYVLPDSIQVNVLAVGAP